jgi:hypothetical protein
MSDSGKGRMFFLEKNKQKTFAYFGQHRASPGSRESGSNEQKFFASFFQKRRIFLPSKHVS